VQRISESRLAQQGAVKLSRVQRCPKGVHELRRLHISSEVRRGSVAQEGVACSIAL
jgi:hypothetical protein